MSNKWLVISNDENYFSIIHYLLLIIHHSYFVEQTGIEPVPLVFQTNVHTEYTTLPYFMSNDNNHSPITNYLLFITKKVKSCLYFYWLKIFCSWQLFFFSSFVWMVTGQLFTIWIFMVLYQFCIDQLFTSSTL